MQASMKTEMEMMALARLMTRDLRRYLAVAVSRGETVDNAPAAAVIYRRGQALPYRFAMMTIGNVLIRVRRMGH